MDLSPFPLRMAFSLLPQNILVVSFPLCFINAQLEFW
jgi:hypothetical protein